MSRTDVAVATVVGTQMVARFGAKSYQRGIERCNITGPTGSTCTVYVGIISQQNVRDSSPNGGGDTAEWPSPIVIPAGNDLLFVWNKVDAAKPGIVNLQWQDNG